jgi:hypothetical protein
MVGALTDAIARLWGRATQSSGTLEWYHFVIVFLVLGGALTFELVLVYRDEKRRHKEEEKYKKYWRRY